MPSPFSAPFLLDDLPAIVLGHPAIENAGHSWDDLAATGSAFTVSRPVDYRSALARWSDTVAKRPAHARARSTLGPLLSKADRFEESLA